MSRFSQLLAILLALSSNLHALQLTGEAHGPTREEARKQAMAALSESIKIEVKSVFQSEKTSDGYSDANKRVTTTSELPLLGVEVDLTTKRDGYFCIAWLDSDKSVRLYQAELTTLANAIQTQQQQLKQQQDNAKRYRLLGRLLTDVEQFNNYHTVAQLLGAKGLPQLTVDSTTLSSELLTLEAAASTLAIAAEVLTRALPPEAYYVQPLLPHGSSQATPLSRQLRDTIRAQVSSYEDRAQASNYLKGSYEILSDGISVTLRAVDRNGITLASRVAKLAPSAYQGIDHQPTSISFDQLLHQGSVISNDYRAELNTNQGKEDLLFTPGQSIELFARLNNPGWFYIASHNVSDNLSYLVELSESKGKHAFIRYVNADQTNRWLSLGKFEVTKPYGTENLQMIASTKPLIDHLPATAYDKALGLHIVQSITPQQAVLKTRGLKPKRNKGKQVRSAEATLSFTTME